MWNRVILLCAGVATGWTAINLLTCPRASVRGQRVRLAISVFFAVTTIVWLAVEMPSAALFGLGVYLVSAVPALIANAQQVSAPKPDSGPQPALPSERSPLIAVDARIATTGRHLLLVSPGPPPYYEGPAGWAHRLWGTNHAPTTLAQRVAFPQTLTRIRQAYDAMPQGHPGAQCCTRVAQRLAQRRPEATVRCVFLQGSPHLRQELRILRQSPPASLMVVLLAAEGSTSEESTREIIASSRLRESTAHLDLLFCPPPEPDGSGIASLVQGAPIATQNREPFCTLLEDLVASMEVH